MVLFLKRYSAVLIQKKKIKDYNSVFSFSFFSFIFSFVFSFLSFFPFFFFFFFFYKSNQPKPDEEHLPLMKDCHPVDRPTFAKNDYFVSTLNLITYGLNAIIFFQNLPIYSPLRASVLKNLTKGVEPGQAAKDFGVHTSTVYRALNKDDFSQTILRKPIEQRNLGDPARISIAKEFFDEAIPVLSGRRYRVKKMHK